MAASADRTLAQTRGQQGDREALAERVSRITVPALPALAVVLAIEAALVLIDLALGKDEAISTAYVIGPFVAALITRASVTAVAGGIAVALALASGFSSEGASGPDLVRAVIVLIGSCFAVFGAWLRERTARSVRRLEILAAIAEIADGSRPLQETVERFCERLLPEPPTSRCWTRWPRGRSRGSASRRSGRARSGSGTWRWRAAHPRRKRRRAPRARSRGASRS
ncbi:MAG: hypothetical protein ACXWFN_05875 [Solirubrobacterales bacterium]